MGGGGAGGPNNVLRRGLEKGRGVLSVGRGDLIYGTPHPGQTTHPNQNRKHSLLGTMNVPAEARQLEAHFRPTNCFWHRDACPTVNGSPQAADGTAEASADRAVVVNVLAKDIDPDVDMLSV